MSRPRAVRPSKSQGLAATSAGRVLMLQLAPPALAAGVVAIAVGPPPLPPSGMARGVVTAGAVPPLL